MFGAVDGLLMFLCGSREYDELTLCDMFSSLATVISNLCRQSGKGQRAASEAVRDFGCSTFVTIGICS